MLSSFLLVPQQIWLQPVRATSWRAAVRLFSSLILLEKHNSESFKFYIFPLSAVYLQPGLSFWGGAVRSHEYVMLKKELSHFPEMLQLKQVGSKKSKPLFQSC